MANDETLALDYAIGIDYDDQLFAGAERQQTSPTETVVEDEDGLFYVYVL